MNKTMQHATIKLFLTTGYANGVRTAELANWTGKAIAGPRTELSALLKRKELDRPGVYFLLGVDEADEPMIYIGEAENLRSRLPDHRKKDFWTSVIVFSSNDTNLTKAHVRYLEAALIDRAQAIGNAKLRNNKGGKSSLPESDLADMQVYLEKMIQLLPILGCTAFTEPETATKQTTILHCRTGKVHAKGYRTSTGFLVLEGSTASLTTTASCAQGTIKRREKLNKKGILAAEGDLYRFTGNAEFTSPSSAATAIRGSSTNGLTQWKTEDGHTLKSLESDDEA